MTIAALGTEILVSTAFIQMYPQITTLADGGFAVTWWSTDDGTTVRSAAGCSQPSTR